MTITMSQVEKLARLYEQRKDLQKAREYAAEQNFWLGVLDDAFRGTGGTRSFVMERMGGRADFVALLSRSVVNRFEEMQRHLDVEIEQNGGQP